MKKFALRVIQYTGENKDELEAYLSGVTIRVYKDDRIAHIQGRVDAVLIYPYEYVMQRGDTLMVCPQDIYEFIHPKE